MQVRETPPFAPVLMESTRAIGYSLEAAIADIIDNSIAAKAGKVQLSFFPVGDAYVSILDNGTGMDDAQMNIAMQYGSKSPTETRDSSDLGRYGLGLKTASLSQCRVLTVISKQGDQVIGRRWDLDYVIKTGAWSLLILDKEDFASVPHISDLYEQDSGTLVVWQNLDRLLMGEVDYEKSLGRKMDEVRQHLELVFHRYLSGESGIKKLEILFNGVKLKAADPFLIKKSTQAMDTETLVIRGKRILVTPYILPHISKMTEEEKNQLGGKDGIRKRQGFYVYRNKRLLIWGTWFRMMRQGDLSKLARVMVDIPNDLDDLWTLDIKKSHAIPPAEVRNSLQTVIDRIADKSKRTWTFRGKKETSDSVEHNTTGKIMLPMLLMKHQCVVYKVVDLFAGAGGLSLGFMQTRKYDIKVAFENSPYMQETYRLNHPGVEVQGDVCAANYDEIKEKYGDIDVVIGGPPCQGFSNANRQKNHAISQNNILL